MSDLLKTIQQNQDAAADVFMAVFLAFVVFWVGLYWVIKAWRGR